MAMNKISSKKYLVGCLRAARRPDTHECPQCVHENREKASTICFAIADSRQVRTTYLFNATQVPPVTGFVCPASLGSSAPMFERSRRGIAKEPMNYTLPTQLERGVWYEA
jgi:hypothetical protein